MSDSAAYLISCPKCDGKGYLKGGPAFVNAGETPEESTTCDECQGASTVLPKFFVEFVVKSNLSGAKYWLPLSLNTNDLAIAKKILNATSRELSKQFAIRWQSQPILELEWKRPLINAQFRNHSKKGLTILNVEGWRFTDVESKPEWSFDEHLDYAIESSPLNHDRIATCMEAHQFPVRVLSKGNFPEDWDEFLLIRVVLP